MKRLVFELLFLGAGLLVSCNSSKMKGYEWLEGKWDIPSGEECLTLVVKKGKYGFVSYDIKLKMKKIEIQDASPDVLDALELPREGAYKSFAEGECLIDIDNHQVYYGYFPYPLDKYPDEIKSKKKAEKISQSSTTSSAPYKVTNKRNKIEKRLVEEFNSSTDKTISFSTDLTNLKQDIIFSMTPKQPQGDIKTGFCLFWAQPRPGKYRALIRGEYELKGSVLKVFNTYVDKQRDRLFDRDYDISIDKSGVHLNGEYVSKKGTQCEMVLSHDFDMVVRDVVRAR